MTPSAFLILRPEPGAAATAARARAAGWTAVATPLFEARAIAWPPADPRDHDAVMLTSAHAARLGGEGLAALRALPAYAVGRASAEAARAAGFIQVRAGEGDAADLLARAGADGVTRLLHLAGREHRAVEHAGVTIERRIVYAAEAVAALPAAARNALTGGAIALLHSPRAAAAFRALIGAAGLAPGTIAIAAISAPALTAAGPGWRAAVAAARPTDDALLAAAARLCE